MVNKEEHLAALQDTHSQIPCPPFRPALSESCTF